MSCKSNKDDLVQLRTRPAYWKSVEELAGGRRGAGTEFPGGLPGPGSDGGDATRRDFLSMMGFSLGAAGLAACRAPVQHAVPLPVGSDTIIPGVANYYATTCRGCASSCGLLVKQRDGRPIKVDGNPDSPVFGGGSCATGQATVLSLYDDERLRGPMVGDKAGEWEEVDRRVLEALEQSKAAGRKIVLLSGTINSPSTREILGEWSQRFPTFAHVTYDPLSLSALRAASQQAFGEAVVPHYAFDRARVIVALEADFLGTWLSPVEFSRQYARARRSLAEPLLHVQVESGLSITGTNADQRIPVAPSELGGVAVGLLARVATRARVGGVADLPGGANARKLDDIAEALWKHRGASLIVSGSRDVNVQIVVHALNVLLGNVGQTVDVTSPSLQRQGDDAAMAALVADMNAGRVGTLILHGANPLYDYPDAARFREGLRKVGLVVSLGDRRDETAAEAHVIAPDHHFLESWGDAEPVAGYFSLSQPLIAPLHATRAAQDSLLRWLGTDPGYYTRLRAFWRASIFPRVTQKDQGDLDFDPFWDRTLERGFAVAPVEDKPQPDFKANFKKAAAAVAGEAGSGGRGAELHFYESVAMRDGRAGNNPWLQELADPVSKVTWSNYAAVAESMANELGVKGGDVIAVKTGLGELALPVVVQPGQHARTISVAYGYGRTRAGKVGDGRGVSVFPLAAARILPATVTKTDRRAPLASTQSQFTLDYMHPVVEETTYAELARGKQGEKPEKEELPNLWTERLEGEHSWGMSIDQNLCTGCSACVVSCQAENNVPVVGEDQIRRVRTMAWLRLDHYYSGPVDNPQSMHQPMLCQHCQHAPCETVCPVLATTTSSEGINQQVYNRCIGTRYCLNNCPYKVRRFNWYNYTDNDAFDFNMASPLGRMVLNPDVTVRSRGVMEKCSLCVQRIQLAKNTALKERRELVDGDIQSACQQACPTGAIVFGDLKDPKSRVSRLLDGPRTYKVLEDLGTRPNIGYLKKIRNGQET